MATEKLPIIFVPGAAHTKFHLKDVIPHLDSLNYAVIPVELRTNTKTEPPPELQNNVDDILEAIRSQATAGRNFALVGHSVAGHSVTLAASEFLATASAAEKSLLTHLVLVACYLDSARLVPYLGWAKVVDDGLWTEVVNPSDVFYNAITPDQARPFVDALAANRAQWPPPFPDAFKSLNGTYFLCANDKAIPPHIQRLEAAEMGMRVVELDTDHVPFVSRPEEFANELHKVFSGS